MLTLPTCLSERSAELWYAQIQGNDVFILCCLNIRRCFVITHRIMNILYTCCPDNWRFWMVVISYDMIWYYLLTAIGVTPGGSSTVHIYTQTTQSTQTIHRITQSSTWEACGPCPIFVSYTPLTSAIQLRKKHGKSSVTVAEECQLAQWK